MSGHSKWNNIKRKKEKTDGARAKVFTKIGREIAVRAKAFALDLSSLDTSADDVVARYAGQRIDLEPGPLLLDEESVVRAVAKAGTRSTKSKPGFHISEP